MKIDLHVHSWYSKDNPSRPKNIVKKVVAKKLDAVSITDHDTTKAWPKFKELGKKYNIPIVYGQEVSLFENSKKCTGHMLALFINEQVKSTMPLDAIDEIKKQGGIAIMAHPFDRHPYPYPKAVGKFVHGIEVMNSRSYSDEANEKALKLATKLNKTKTAGSDAHLTFEIGRAFTYAKFDTLEEFRKSLLNGKTIPIGKRSSAWVHLIGRIASTIVPKHD